MMAEEVQRPAYHSFCNQQVAGMIAARRNLMKPPRQSIRSRIIAGADAIGPKAPECAQLVIGLIQPHRKFERPFPSDVNFLDGTLRVEERGRKCGRKLHFSS